MSVEAPVLDYVDRWLAYRRRALRLPGLAYAVGQRGRVLRSGAHGVADLVRETPMATEHRFRIASQSKMFTATAIALLAKSGRVSLDDPIGRHVGGLPAGVSDTSVRELLSHGSGLIRDGADARFWNLEADFPQVEDIVSGAGPILARRQQFKYSNVGYALLGMVIAACSGESYDGFIRTRVLDPLELHATSTDVSGGGEELATGHSSARGGQARATLEQRPALGFAPAAGFCSTVTDLTTWAGAHCLGGEQLLDDDDRRLLQQAQWQVPGDAARDYGLGFDGTRIGDRRMLGHGGAYPGFITATMFDPTDGLSVVVLTNAIDAPAQELAAGVVKIQNLAASLSTEPSPVSSPDAARCAGRYEGLWRTLDIAHLGAHLVAVDPELADPTQNVVRLTADTDPTRLRIVDGPGFGPVGEPVTVTDNGLIWAGVPMRRIDR